jgi:hypothetical protein
MNVCKTAVFCAIRFVPLWSLVVVVFVFGFLRRTIMASVTRLPYKSIAAIGATSLVLGIAHVDLKATLLKVVTGPGSYSRIAVTFFLLANFKNLPFVWHVSDLTIAPESRRVGTLTN